MTYEEMEALKMLEVGYARYIPEAKQLTLEIVKRSVKLYEMLEEKEKAGQQKTGTEYSLDEKLVLIEDHTLSDPIIKVMGQIERIIYRLRIDAGIWPSDFDPTKES